MALEDELRSVLQAFIDAEEIPHLLLIGPAGSGKTTIARILTRALDCRVLSLNASAERGIDVVRQKIAAFVTALGVARWNIVFLDEADAMTADAQTAMRNLVELYADTSRFILTGNYPYKIIGPIQSRCQVLTMGRPPLQERFRILDTVLRAEDIESTPHITLSYAERYPDLRQMLMAAQRAYLGKGTLHIASQPDNASGTNILDAVTTKNWTALRHMTSDGAFDPGQALRDFFWAIPDNHPRAGFLRHVVGRGVHESGFTPDAIILFLGVCAEVMEGL